MSGPAPAAAASSSKGVRRESEPVRRQGSQKSRGMACVPTAPLTLSLPCRSAAWYTGTVAPLRQVRLAARRRLVQADLERDGAVGDLHVLGPGRRELDLAEHEDRQEHGISSARRRPGRPCRRLRQVGLHDQGASRSTGKMALSLDPGRPRTTALVKRRMARRRSWSTGILWNCSWYVTAASK